MSSLTGTPSVVVVGSANVDLVTTVKSLPKPGETVLVTASSQHPGGKGSNQATAIARLGGHVAFVGRRGADDQGDLLARHLDAEGVDTSAFRVTPGVPSGTAIVMLDENAENSILVIPGANNEVAPEDISDSADLIKSASAVVAQLEVAIDTVIEAARATRGTFILNAAPAQRLSEELLQLTDVLVVNEHEYETVIGGDAGAAPNVVVSTLRAHPSAPSAIVITRGAHGARVWDGDELTDVPARKVNAVDTTGAGDTFVGALAEAIVRGEHLVDAARWATTAASVSTESIGATPGMPTAAQVSAAMNESGDR